MNTVRRLVVGGTALLAIAAVTFGTTAAHAQKPAMAQAPGAVGARSAQPLLSNDQRELYRKAFAAADSGQWDDVHRLAAQGKDPLANKLLHWLELLQPRSGLSFEDLASFIDANPDWPGQDTLMRRAEEALVDRTDDSVVMAWFALRGPVTVDGAMRYIEALLRANERTKAVALIRTTWHSGAFGDKQEDAFLSRYKQHLSREDHVRRLDRLIWDGRYTEARRTMKLVDSGNRALADARIRLATLSPGVEGAIRRVPEHLLRDPGLVFERIRWRRRKDQIDGAMELMRRPPAQLGRPELWWNEREFLARKALAEGHASEAYRLVRDHHMSSGANYVEAEFLAGWIALRFRHDSRSALPHFTHIYDAGHYPVTRARGAYWAGRAAEAGGEPKTARMWYEKAAQYPVTYYGQLALAKLDPSARPSWPTMPQPTPAERRAFERSELTRAALLLDELGVADRVKPFVMRQITLAKSPGQHALVSELALNMGRPDLAVAAAKRSAQIANVLLPDYGWPTLDVVNGDTPERALILATIRQESAFETQAISRAGARGMMQLMPATARAIAKSLGLASDHTERRLVSDPHYNVQLGRTYLGRLLDDFDGSYVLALAAYNAGPSRVRQWLRDYGDPRQPKVDVIDWIETIPFGETRNYVQRVLENVQVYRQILGGSQLAQGIQHDLRRGAN